MIKNPEIKPGFKPSPLGPIPKDWDVKDLEDFITSISNGVTYNPESNAGYPITRIETIADCTINEEKVGLTPYSESLEKFKLKKGEILYSHINSVIHIGKTAYCEKDYEILHGMNLLRLKPKSNVDSKFFYYILNSGYGRRQAYAGAKRAVNQASLSTSEIKLFKLPYPPLPEQQKIASILSTWDTAISKTQQLINQLKQRNRGLQQQLLSGKKRLPGFNGKLKKISAGDVFKSVSVKCNNDEELLSVTQDNGVIPRTMLEARVTMPSGETSSFKLVEQGDFVISLRSFQGGIEFSQYRGVVSPAYTVLKPKQSIDEDFYKYYFKSYDFIGHLAVAVIGIRDGKQVSYDDFCTVKIPYTDPIEQSAIATILKKADQELGIQLKKLDVLKRQKKGLMQKLLTGEVRVKI